MTHLETQSGACCHLGVEQSTQDGIARPFPEYVVDPCRLRADQDSNLRKFDRVFLRQYMEAMLDRGGFSSHYQPQYTVGSLRGVETLLRLPHPERGFIGPDLFIPIAEESGVSELLGLWVIRKACVQMKQWQSEFAGIHFAMGDFGSGHSSFQNLQRFPISTLKLDRSLVEGMAKRISSFEIVDAVIAIGHGLGMQVIAEGVEREEQRRVLLNLGCDAMQGFLFSPAVSANVIREIIARNAASIHDGSQG